MVSQFRQKGDKCCCCSMESYLKIQASEVKSHVYKISRREAIHEEEDERIQQDENKPLLLRRVPNTVKPLSVFYSNIYAYHKRIAYTF